MSAFARSDISVLGRWWWTVDRWTIAAVIALLTAGIFLILAASPPVAERLEFDTFHFVSRQLLFLPLAIISMLTVSLLNRAYVLRLSLFAFGIAILLMIFTLVDGIEIKGATRWVDLAGMSIQPSEFVKPAFAVIAAWMFSAWRLKEGFPGYLVVLGLCGGVVLLLLAQPDVGMAILISFVCYISGFFFPIPVNFG